MQECVRKRLGFCTSKATEDVLMS